MDEMEKVLKGLETLANLTKDYADPSAGLVPAEGVKQRLCISGHFATPNVVNIPRDDLYCLAQMYDIGQAQADMILERLDHRPNLEAGVERNLVARKEMYFNRCAVHQMIHE